jgi:hypothetical protein
MGFIDETRRPKVSPLRLIWLTTLIFCLRHRCTKNQVLQVFGRVEQGIKSSEVLQTSPPKFFFQLEPVRFRSSLEVRRTFLIPDVMCNFWITYFLLEKETKERGLVLRAFSLTSFDIY